VGRLGRGLDRPPGFLVGVCVLGGHLSPRRELHDRCAALRGLSGSPGTRWSAVQGSVASAPLPHRWQVMAVARTYADSCRYLPR
jgi:hypothetical protein